MIRRLLAQTLGAAFFAAVLLPSVAQAEPQYAFGALLGPSVVVENEEYEDDLTFGGSIRTDFGGPGVEFTVLYTQIEGRGSDGDEDLDVELDLLSFGLAGRYDLKISIVDLYGLAGLELYVNELKGKAVSAGGGGAVVAVGVDSVDLGLQVGAGAMLELGPVGIGPEIRYRRLLTDNYGDDDALSGTGLDKRIGIVSVLGRLEFHFP